MTIASSARTRQVGDAAIAVLAGQGARGLTHRAVDQAAGLPSGTTSNYARTRAALLTLALARIAELDAAEGAGGASELSGSGYYGSGISSPGISGSGSSGAGISGSGLSGAGISGSGLSGAELAEGLALMLDRMIRSPGVRSRVIARFELALEATRRPELRAVYDEMGRGFRAEAARLLAAGGSADPERDAWTVIAWMEGTAFYALAGGVRRPLRRWTCSGSAHPAAGHDDRGGA